MDDVSRQDEQLAKFRPLDLTLNDIRAAIPRRLFNRDTYRSFRFLARDLLMASALWWAATYIDPLYRRNSDAYTEYRFLASLARWALWAVYWWFQGLIFTGLWVIGHECNHNAFSPSRTICDSVGFILHSALFTPYFSWKISHHRHHSYHASMEKDEVYVPKTRSSLGLPAISKDSHHDHHDLEDLLGDTPLYTLYTLVRQQLLAFPAYLLWNVSGQPGYPKWTNHFDPNSILFTPTQRPAVLMSNAGILAMIFILRKASQIFGIADVIKFYGVPWLCVTHWFIMVTYLHHTSPEIPHYRGDAWNYQRGAAATVDRDFLGWQGRLFLHDVAHYHVIHHFFPQIPFYHAPEATEYLKLCLGEHYLRSNEPVFKALWRSYNDCQFVEDTGDVLFYRDRKGRYVREPDVIS